MFVDHPPAGIGKARVRIQPPYWRHYSKEVDLGIIELESGKRAVSMQTDWSNRLLMELREGMQPVLRYWDNADATADIEVMLSALNFQDSLDMFHQCLGQLVKYDFKQEAHSIVHFHEDSSRLRSKAIEQLAEIAELLKTDATIKLELYTSRTGLEKYNFRLATRRSRAIRDYMLKQGIEEDRILIKVYTKTDKELKALGYSPADVHILLTR